MSWFVTYTKPNFEIKAAENLKAMGIEAYCPTFTQLKQYSDRKKKVIKPLLPSYLLVKIKEKDRSKVFMVPGIIRYLFWLGKPALVNEKEIELMKNSLSGIYESVLIEKLTIGSEYNITSGPLKGQSGKIVRMSKNKIKLELASLGVNVLLKVA